MFKEGSPIAYDAPADLKKWPSLNNQRLNGNTRPYLVFIRHTRAVRTGTDGQTHQEHLALRHRYRPAAVFQPDGPVAG